MASFTFFRVVPTSVIKAKEKPVEVLRFLNACEWATVTYRVARSQRHTWDPHSLISYLHRLDHELPNQVKEKASLTKRGIP